MIHAFQLDQWIDVIMMDHSYGWSRAHAALGKALGFRVNGSNARWRTGRLSDREKVFAIQRIEMIVAGTLVAKHINGRMRAIMVDPPEPPRGTRIVCSACLTPHGIQLVH